MRPVQSIALLSLALAPIGMAKSACGQAGMTLTIPDEDLIVDTDDDVFIVTVIRVSDHKATRANPPRVVLSVEETARGPEQKEFSVDWEFPYDPEFTPPDFFPIPTEAERKADRKFAREALDNPVLGSKWVIITFDPGDNDDVREFIVSGKFPLSKKRHRWVYEQLKLRNQYVAERILYRDRWLETIPLHGNQLSDGARQVDDGTELRPGTQLLLRWATTTPCSVIEVLKDGHVRVRRHGYDSRSDHVVKRETLMLYPANLLDTQKGGDSKLNRNGNNSRQPTNLGGKVGCDDHRISIFKSFRFPIIGRRFRTARFTKAN